MLYTEGSLDAKIAFIGQSAGEEEARTGRPFIGNAGRRFNKLLQNVSIPRSDCYITNVVKAHPPGNKISLYINIDKGRVTTSREYDEFERQLWKELATCSANVLVPLGKEALYALTRRTTITYNRGSILKATSPGLKGRKVIPTFHPSSTFHTYLNNYYILEDLKRIKRHSLFPELRLPIREYNLHPSYDLTMDYLNTCLQKGLEGNTIAFDIEVLRSIREISCISFAYDTRSAISIPFIASGRDYFMPYHEINIWKKIAEVLEHKGIRKVAHNMAFDLGFIFQRTGIITQNYDDTMIAHGIALPDFKKALWILQSLYSDEPFYKDEGARMIKTGLGSEEKFWLYNAKDSVVLQDILEQVLALIIASDNEEVYKNQLKTIEPLTYVVSKGMNIDKIAMQTDSVDNANIAKEIMNKVTKQTNGIITMSRSYKQIKQYFYVERNEKPIFGKMSTDEKALKILATRGHKSASLILKARQLENRNSKYLNVDLDYEDGKLHASANPVGTRMGRFSFSKNIFNEGLNIQTIPKDVRKYITPDPGFLFYEADLSQAENRIVAYIAPEPRMIHAFEHDIDMHALTGAMISGLSIEEVIKQDNEGINCDIGDGLHSWRYWGKKGNHAVNYGEGYIRAARDWEILTKESKVILTLIHNSYPGIRIYHNWIEFELKTNNMTLTNLYGRNYRFKDRPGPDLNRSAYSFIPQSTVPDKLNSEGFCYMYYNQELFKPVEILNQVQDSIWMQMSYKYYDISKHAEVLIRLRDQLKQPLKWRSTSFVIPLDVTMGFNFQGKKKGNHKGLISIPMKNISEVSILTNILKENLEKLQVNAS